jgi:hypothetical protein
VKLPRLMASLLITAAASVGMWQWLTAVSVIGTVTVTSGCGIECGDGTVEGGEECDDGNNDETDFCRSCMNYTPPRTTITWDFNKYPERGFGGDQCLDTGVANVQVDIAGAVSATATDKCSSRQVAFFDLPPGPYSVSLTPLDAAGVPRVKAPVVVAIMATAANTQTDVNIPFDAWTSGANGLFLFRVSWAGKTCSAAAPPVVTQSLKLLVRGQPVTALTDTGQKVDGTDDKPCHELSEEKPQNVMDLPFGPATLEVVGKDSAGVEKYRKLFDTFVGIGQVNPTLQFSVPAI